LEMVKRHSDYVDGARRPRRDETLNSHSSPFFEGSARPVSGSNVTIIKMGKFRHSHIVPRSQVALFATDGKVDCHFVRDGTNRLIGPKNVAVRKNIYTERRSDGSSSTAFEEALGPLEAQAVDVLRDLEERWPLSDADRATVAEYLALQAVRSPAFRDFFERARGQSLNERLQELDPPQRDLLRERSKSDRFRLNLMLSQIAKMGTVIGSMYWALIRFQGPRLLSSDHPLAPVSITGATDAVSAAVPASGFMNTSEFRFPVAPNVALLLNWRDVPDDQPVVNGKLHHLKTLNASVRDQAEEHWFHQPGAKTPCAVGGLVPISFEVFSDYDLEHVLGSRRRHEVDAAITEMIDTEEVGRMQMIRISKPDLIAARPV
jgi:Protein of unknown function (DUF4238)